MEQQEQVIVAEAASNLLREAYALLLVALGVEGAGQVISAQAYPALLEIGWLPPIGLKIDPVSLGPRGTQLYAVMSSREEQE